MAFALKRERQFDLALTHQGPVAVLEIEFSFVFVSGLWSDSIEELETYLNVGLYSAQVLPIIQTNYLGYSIEADTRPLIDRYRVKIMLAGEVEASRGELGPFLPFSLAQSPQGIIALPPLLVLVTAIGIAGLFGVIAYRTFTVGLAAALGIPPWAIGLGAVAVGLALVGGLGKEKRRENA